MADSKNASISPWLLVLAGRPGTGKTTLAKALVQTTGACYLRIDVVETALLRTHTEAGPGGYFVTHGLALSNLCLGNNVIVDAVNAVPEARAGWAETARGAGARLVLMETALGDQGEHRRRIESRTPDVAGHRVPTWEEVQNEPWASWDEARDGERHLIDTTSASQARETALALLRIV